MPDLHYSPRALRPALPLLGLGLGLALTGVAAAQSSFAFATRSGVATGTYITSETVTMSGYDGSLAVSIGDDQTGGTDASTAQYSIDNGPFTTAAGQIASGHTLTVRHLSSPRASTTRATRITVGSYATEFQSTTTTADTTPDTFDFGALGNVNPSVWVESGVLTPAGFTGTLPVVPSSGGQFRIINSDGSTTGWLTSGKITPGQKIAVRHTSASGKLVYTKSTYKIGTTSGSWLTRTQGPVSGSATPSTTAPPANATLAPPPTNTPPTPPVDLTKPLAAYLHGLSPKLAGVTAPYTLPYSATGVSLEHYSIPVSDGTILDSYVQRPTGGTNQPLVLVISPYYGGGDPTKSALGMPSSQFARYLVPHGYAVGFISVGGTGNSGGCFRDGGPIERKQLYDAVEYMAHRPWANGKVATMGVSYDGTTPTELFVNPPPSLATVIPMEGITDYYRYSFNNGMRRSSNSAFITYYYAIVGAAPAGLEGGVGPTEPTSYMTELQGEPCQDQLANQQESIHAVQTGDKTPYWDSRDAIALINATPNIKRPPVFYIEGYQDANVDPLMANGYLEAIKTTGVPLHIWHGQWVHAYPQDTGADTGTLCASAGPCRGDFWEGALLAWLDHWMLGKDTGIMDAPMVQTEGDDGVWRHETQWPPKNVTPTAMYLSSDNKLLAAATKGTVTYTDITGDNSEPTPATGGTPIEFTSAPLTDTLRLTGMVHLDTLATADAQRAGLVATLMEQKADGTRRYLTFTALDLNHAATLASADANITGKALPVSLNFFMEDNVIAKGSTLVLNIGGLVPSGVTTSGNTDNLLNSGPNLEPVGVGAHVTLDLTKTKLTLPVNGSTVPETISWKTQ